MIVFLVRRRLEEQPLQTYLDDWRSPAAPAMQTLEYSEALDAQVLPWATYVFGDVEALAGRHLDAAIRLADRLGDADVQVVNHPRRALGRRALLDQLFEEGVNPFRVHPLRDRAHVRYPVFLRHERRHWQLSGLLGSSREVERAIVGAVLRGRDPEELLLVEFFDTSDDDGMFRKYGAYMVGDTIVPQHVMFSRHWLVKDDLPYEPWMTAEALQYVLDNPHAAQLAPVCSRAGISYGRVDYACLDDRLVVWEINTNPTVMSRHVPESEDATPQRRHTFRDRFDEALARLDADDRDRVITLTSVESAPKIPHMHSPWRQRLKPIVDPVVAAIERAPDPVIGPLHRQVLKWVDAA